MFEVKDIKKTFGKMPVLRGISMQVQKGDVVVMLGPSGSGKTTFLRCLNFLEHADSGTIAFDDWRLDLAHAKKTDIAKVRKRTAFVFQNYNLFNNKTALQNVMEGLIIARKIPKNTALEIAKNALDKVSLSDRLNYYPTQLSGGQQQRVGIARAFAVNPDVLLFDEPTSALDPEITGEVLDVIKALAGEGKTMIIITHEISFAKDIANKIIFIDDGLIVEEGMPNDILVHPKKERTQMFLKRIKIPAAERRGIFVLPESCTSGLIPSVTPQSGGVLNPTARINGYGVEYMI
ncbi:MAG: amino acid ABC transporter ATP-binding protein [Termitinemataceae bacterium]|nr:MAG: amino acid ABC transporter ATP-binding protein [Termitinemataceae bacterium]